MINTNTAILSMSASVDGITTDFRYVNGNNTIQIGFITYPMHSGGQPSFQQLYTIILDPATKANLTPESFEQICLEWCEDWVTAAEAVGY